MYTGHIKQSKSCLHDWFNLTVVWPMPAFWSCFGILKKKKRQDYESCIELLRNVNNTKSKPVHYTD